jgi:hypothetical protein
MKDIRNLKGYDVVSVFSEFVAYYVRQDSLKEFLSLSVKNMLLILGLVATVEQETLISSYVEIISKA